MKWILAITAGVVLGVLFADGPSDQEVADAMHKAHMDARKAEREDRKQRKLEQLYQAYKPN